MAAPNNSCAAALDITDCLAGDNRGVTSVGPDPLNDLLGTGGGHALWYKWTAPPLTPNGEVVAFMLTPGSPAIGNINGAVLAGACGAQTIGMVTQGTSITLAPSRNTFTGRASSGTRTSNGSSGAQAPASIGSYVQNAALPVTISGHVNAGQTVYIEIDNYDGTAQGVFNICVSLDTAPVFTFRDNFWRIGA